jgi:hypothetical protein
MQLVSAIPAMLLQLEFNCLETAQATLYIYCLESYVQKCLATLQHVCLLRFTSLDKYLASTC